MRNIIKLIGLGLWLTAINTANAAFRDEGSPILLEVEEGSSGSVDYPGYPVSEYHPPLQLDGFFGSQVTLKKPSVLTFAIRSFDSDYGNQFLLNDTVIFDTEAPELSEAPQEMVDDASPKRLPHGEQFEHTQYFPAGLVPFSFRVTTTGQSIANGSNPNNWNRDVNVPNFFASIYNIHMISGDFVFLAFDDGGGGPDNDYDDMLLGISAVEVPEPGTLPMLSLGLVGLVALRKRIIKR